jgi:hypothetical protein
MPERKKKITGTTSNIHAKCKKSQDQKPSDAREKENVMTIEEYKSIQRSIVATLRDKSDLSPRCRISPGCAPAESTFFTVKAFLDSEEGVGYNMIRGYKLFTLVRNNKKECTCFVAKPHAVVQNTETGKMTCLIQNPHDLKDEFIFVPSSLMHRELSDDELCSGRFMLCDVIGGDVGVVADITAISVCLSRFEKRRLTTRPGQLLAPPSIYIRFFPGFREWFKSKNRTIPDSLLTDMALSFGMPFRPNIVTDQIHGCLQTTLCEEKIHTNELTHPQKPFEFEEDTWLPSVRVLHEFYDLVSCELTDMTTEEKLPLYLKIYNTLQNEYWFRLRDIGKRSFAENKARVYGQWK